MAQKIFTNGFISKSMNGLACDNLDLSLYHQDLFEYKEEDVLVNNSIATFDIKLLPPTAKENFNFENACTIYDALKLTPVEATDVRLWTYLAHVPFWNYMKKRFPIEKIPVEKQAKYVLDHWFINGLTPRNISRHGIALLWWSAHLTYDPEKGYELTKELFSTIDYTNLLITGTQGRSKNFRMALLEFAVENKPLFSERKQEKLRLLMRKLNCLSGYRLLIHLPKEELKKVFAKYEPELRQIS